MNRAGGLLLIFAAGALIALTISRERESAPPEADPFMDFNGGVYVVDGDSLKFGGEEVRLLCLDAVESRQTCEDANGAAYACGERAREAMEALTRGQDVRCSGDERDVYGRPLVTCHAGGKDLAWAMVAQGWAVATCSRFKKLEAEARDAGRGIWQGRFLRPKTWRKKHPGIGR